MQKAAANIFAWLDGISDGDLVGFAGRMESAPDSQARTLIEQWPRDEFVLPEIGDGELRPVVNRLEGGHDMLNAALRLLLYSNSVVVEHFIAQPYYLSHHDTYLHASEFASRVRSLATIRPLVESGAIAFSDINLYKFFETNPGLEMLALLDAVPKDKWSSPNVNGLGTKGLAYRMANGISAALDKLGNPVAMSKNEEVALTALFTGPILDGRISQANKLANLLVPEYRADPTALVELRRSSEALHNFRQALGASLELILRVPESKAGRREAGEIVVDDLERRLALVRAESNKSPALRAMRGAGRRLAFTGFGAAGGVATLGALGMPLVGAVSGAVTGTAVNAGETIRDLLLARRERRMSRAIWEVVVSFRQVKS